MSVRTVFSATRCLASLASRRHMHASPMLGERAHNRIPDYYSTLGVSRTASAQDIKVAYFRIAKKYHPDTNRDQQAGFMFAFAAEAYDVLSDPETVHNDDNFAFCSKSGKNSAFSA